MFIQLDVENISRTSACHAVVYMEDNGIEIYHAATDPIFENCAYFVLEGTHDDAERARAMIWQLFNHGAAVDIFEISQQELETM